MFNFLKFWKKKPKQEVAPKKIKKSKEELLNDKVAGLKDKDYFILVAKKLQQVFQGRINPSYIGCFDFLFIKDNKAIKLKDGLVNFQKLISSKQIMQTELSIGKLNKIFNQMELIIDKILEMEGLIGASFMSFDKAIVALYDKEIIDSSVLRALKKLADIRNSALRSFDIKQVYYNAKDGKVRLSNPEIINTVKINLVKALAILTEIFEQKQEYFMRKVYLMLQDGRATCKEAINLYKSDGHAPKKTEAVEEESEEPEEETAEEDDDEEEEVVERKPLKKSKKLEAKSSKNKKRRQIEEEEDEDPYHMFG